MESGILVLPGRLESKSIKEVEESMLQTIKNFLKKILPPPVQVFHREIARILDAVSSLRSVVNSLGKIQEQIAKELLLSRKEQKQILDEIVSIRKEQAQLLALNRALRQDVSLKMQEYEDMVARLAEDNAALKQQLKQQHEQQDQKLLALNSEIQRQGHCILQTMDRSARRAANTPILSVLIPVYNVEPYLRDCLDSVVRQSMKELEIICVDDGSTDGSLQILKEYAQKDPRVKVIHKEQNDGLLLARKTAVNAASGAYFLFVDSDDYIGPDLCAFAEEITRTESADIIQFGAEVCDSSHDAAKAAWLKHRITPTPKTLASGEILREAYVNRSYTTTLWGKLYKSDLCKKAYQALPNVYCYAGEDIFTYFYLAYYAQSYIGIPTCAYYTYRHGLGITNAEIMSLEKFEMYCNMSTFVKYIHDNLIQESKEPNLWDSYRALTRRVSEDCCRIYASRIRPEDKEDAWKLLVSYWGDNPIAEESAQKKLGLSFSQSMAEQ